jgi:hypothetical protein
MSDQYMADIKKRIIDVAGSMIEGKVDLIEGCRLISKLRMRFPNPFCNDKVFHIFMAVDSDTDDFVFGEYRKQCDPKYLEEVDRKKNEYAAESRNDIIKGCSALIDFLKKH